MGWTENTEKSKKKYFKLASPGGDKPKGIYYTKKIGGESEKVFCPYLEGEIISIRKVLNEPKANHKWEAYFSYELEFFDPENEKQGRATNMILQLHREARATDKIINMLAGIETPHRLRLGAFKEEGTNYLVIYMKNGGEKVNWKFGWDKEKGDLETVPIIKEIPTGVVDPVSNKEKFNYDRNERSDFLEKVLQTATGIITGQQWSGLNIIGDNSTNSNNAAAKVVDTSKSAVILADVHKHFKTVEPLLTNWNKIAKRIRSEVTDFVEKGLLVGKIKTYANSLSSVEYVFHVQDGTYTMAAELPF